MKSLFLTALMALAGGPLSAALIFTMGEVGSDVVLTASGSANTSTLGYGYPVGLNLPSINTAQASFLVGPADGASLIFFGDAFASAPERFGALNMQIVATEGSGTMAGIINNQALMLPYGYESGATVAGSALFANQSFESLGVTPGSYVWTWGSGDNMDSLTLHIGMVPEPGAYAVLTSAGVLAFVLARRLRRWPSRHSD